MATFRLYNIEDDCLETFALAEHPPYLATSHVWRENVFPADAAFEDCFGGQGVVAVVRERYPEIRYCWFDTRCILQDDEQDKLTQIPLMDRIYGQAEAVIIFLTTHLNATQSQVEWLTHKIDGALAMCQAEAWKEEGAYWQHGEGRKWLALAMKALIRLADTPWATRIWTLQEYVLAKKVVWIGLDLQPIEVDEFVFSALPDICDTLVLDELLLPEFRALNDYFVGMVNARMKTIDRTRIMELSATREATVPVDEIYGVMAASGVAVQPRPNESRAEVWSRWLQKAVECGNIRWILLPVSSAASDHHERQTCIFPAFHQRHQLSSCSGLDTVRPLGPASVSNGTVTAWARVVGSGWITRRLGPVHEPQNGRIHRDITLILYAEARWSLALKLVWAFGGGRYKLREARVIAQVLVQSYSRARKSVALSKEAAFQPMISSNFQQNAWNDFMELQQIMMLGVNNGIAYLCDIRISSQKDLSFKVIIVLGNSPLPNRFEVLDFEADSSGRSVLMVVEHATLPDKSSVFHKLGMTLGVSDEICQLWLSNPAQEVRIGGYECSGCSIDPRMEAKLSSNSVFAKPKGDSSRHITSRQLRTLERQENHVRLKLFSTANPGFNSSAGIYRSRLQKRRWREILETIHGDFRDILRRRSREAFR